MSYIYSNDLAHMHTHTYTHVHVLTEGASTTTPSIVCSHTGMFDGSMQSDELM